MKAISSKNGKYWIGTEIMDRQKNVTFKLISLIKDKVSTKRNGNEILTVVIGDQAVG